MYKLLIFIGIFFIGSCKTLDVFEKSSSFSSHKWANNDSVIVNFAITDTNSFYNLFFVLRHNSMYAYKNIWVSIDIKDPQAKTTITREFVLADNSKWIGTNIDDIQEHRIAFNDKALRLKKGNYLFVIKQIMRDNPLPNVLSAGIRIQKN
jgi:gliding motility-associated lipoprotein GldH